MNTPIPRKRRNSYYEGKYAKEQGLLALILLSLLVYLLN